MGFSGVGWTVELKLNKKKEKRFDSPNLPLCKYIYPTLCRLVLHIM